MWVSVLATVHCGGGGEILWWGQKFDGDEFVDVFSNPSITYRLTANYLPSFHMQNILPPTLLHLLFFTASLNNPGCLPRNWVLMEGSSLVVTFSLSRIPFLLMELMHRHMQNATGGADLKPFPPHSCSEGTVSIFKSTQASYMSCVRLSLTSAWTLWPPLQTPASAFSTVLLFS